MVVWSTLLHAGALGLVLVSPSISDREPPRVISVELVAPSAPAAAPHKAPAPAPAAPPEAAPEPPPPPKPKEIVLPEKPQAPKPPEKTKPKPKRREEVFKEPPKKQEQNLDDLLADLRGKESKTPPAPAPAPVDTADAATIGPSEGSEVSAEELAWQQRVKRRVREVWIVPPGFRTQPLETRVVVTLDGAGNIVGSPRITRKSGNPWYDDGVLRGLAKASPLPAPPEAGDWVLQFEPGDSL
jgi:outer membrane biosynthesis protein TonB